MTSTAINFVTRNTANDWVNTAKSLGMTFGARAADSDKHGNFVSENYEDLRKNGFFSAGIPRELGGGNATFDELCQIVRAFGQHCGSTALSFAMHTHTIGANVFKYRQGDQSAAKTLKKIACNNLVISTTGANDWLESSGNATRVQGGYRVSARKRFVSGSTGADMLVTSATYDGEGKREVLHFAVPINTEGVARMNNWDTLGMRSTGSNDVVLENVFVPDSAIVARRPAGQWHPMWEVILPVALPLISAAYVGLADAASQLAIESAKRRSADLAPVVGQMRTPLVVARMTLADMIRCNDNYGFAPSLEATEAVLTKKAIIAETTKQVVEIASELVGGPGFFRGHAMERIVRDVRAMNFHPLPIRRQQLFSGRFVLGLDPVKL